ENFNGTAGLAKSLRVDLSQGLATGQVGRTRAHALFGAPSFLVTAWFCLSLLHSGDCYSAGFQQFFCTWLLCSTLVQLIHGDVISIFLLDKYVGQSMLPGKSG
ncbi:unnamed protein product, partial [Ectocarpus sp. 13 AM-2016]